MGYQIISNATRFKPQSKTGSRVRTVLYLTQHQPYPNYHAAVHLGKFYSLIERLASFQREEHIHSSACGV